MLPDVTAIITEGDILHTVIWGKERGKQGLLQNYYIGNYFPRLSQELERADVRANPRCKLCTRHNDFLHNNPALYPGLFMLLIQVLVIAHHGRMTFPDVIVTFLLL